VDEMSIWLLAGSGGHHGSFGNSDGLTRTAVYTGGRVRAAVAGSGGPGSMAFIAWKRLPGVCAQPSTLSPLDLAAWTVFSKL